MEAGRRGGEVEGRRLCRLGAQQARALTSTMSEFVRLSCGSLYSVYLSSTLSMSVLAYWNSLLEWLKMMSAISQSQSTLSSYAFFISPNLRLVNVTCRRVGGRPRLSQGLPRSPTHRQLDRAPASG